MASVTHVMFSPACPIWPASCVTRVFSSPRLSPGRHSVTRYELNGIVEAQRSWAAFSMVVCSCADGARDRLFNSGMASSGSEAASSGGQGESSVRTGSEGESEYLFDNIAPGPRHE